ncbi:hypothetical protein [Chryseobacterium bernardetii]|uniref:hypothetical protein n=1 Tax=Chryseobacterium bernardetii TaxID=1241978 RepID=UPI001E569A2B|nr:hypothetical protein [Chryseobacterium bernardetii]
MMETKSPFLDTVFLLRKNECITLFSNIRAISLTEEHEAEVYFEAEFEKERLEFLSDQLTCNKTTAVWAAKVLYYSAQLYLVREKTADNLDNLIPEFKGTRDISSILSADLSLRFLPEIIFALNSADPEDPLIKILEEILTEFHYSGVGYDLDLGKVNWEEELKDKTYRKLYLERIVEKKIINLRKFRSSINCLWQNLECIKKHFGEN